MAMPKAMTIIELDDFRKFDAIVKEGVETTVQVGNALTRIRDDHLYRKDFTSFDDYCDRRFGKTRQWAHLLIKTTAVVQQLPKRVSRALDSQAAVVELAKVPEQDRPAVVARASAVTGTATASAIRKAAKPAEAKDCLGIVLPKERLEMWQRRDYALQILQLLGEASKALDQAKTNEDALFSEVNMQQSITDLHRVAADVRRAVPFCVCPGCQGRTQVKCVLCKGRGLISEFLWNSPAVTKEIKKLHLKQVES